MRDDDLSSYTGTIEQAEAFAQRIFREVMRRRIDRAGEVCVFGDGASWKWNIVDEYFNGATQIADLYHAREHYWTVARACFGPE